MVWAWYWMVGAFRYFWVFYSNTKGTLCNLWMFRPFIWWCPSRGWFIAPISLQRSSYWLLSQQFRKLVNLPELSWFGTIQASQEALMIQHLLTESRSSATSACLCYRSMKLCMGSRIDDLNSLKWISSLRGPLILFKKKSVPLFDWTHDS